MVEAEEPQHNTTSKICLASELHTWCACTELRRYRCLAHRHGALLDFLIRSDAPLTNQKRPSSTSQPRIWTSNSRLRHGGQLTKGPRKLAIIRVSSPNPLPRNAPSICTHFAVREIVQRSSVVFSNPPQWSLNRTITRGSRDESYRWFTTSSVKLTNRCESQRYVRSLWSMYISSFGSLCHPIFRGEEQKFSVTSRRRPQRFLAQYQSSIRYEVLCRLSRLCRSCFQKTTGSIGVA